MSDRKDFFFEQILKENDVDDAFGDMERADWNQLSDLRSIGLVAGGKVTPSGVLPQCDVDAFVAYDSLGRRCVLPSLITVDFTNDTAGNPTIPTAAHFRWISIVARYAKFGDDPQLDGDANTVYFLQTEGISNTGDVTVDLNPTNFGKLRVLSATEAASIGAAARPSGLGDDVLIADLLLDDTGLVVTGLSFGRIGVSVARATRQTLMRSGAPFQTSNYDLVKIYLLEEISTNDTNGMKLRRFAAEDGGPAHLFTVNASWDPVTQLWSADQVGFPSTLYELGVEAFQICSRTTGGATWTNGRHDPAGWDARFTLLQQTTDGDVTINGDGSIVGTGPSAAFVGIGGVFPATAGGYGTAFTWPQELAADPSSLTLTTVAPSADVDGGVFSAMTTTIQLAKKFGGMVLFNSVSGGVVNGVRKAVSVP